LGGDSFSLHRPLQSRPCEHCLAYKEVAEDAYEEWESQHHEACLLLQNRAQALQQVYNKMEQNLEVGRCMGD
jgi:hypothetical protein